MLDLGMQRPHARDGGGHLAGIFLVEGGGGVDVGGEDGEGGRVVVVGVGGYASSGLPPLRLGVAEMGEGEGGWWSHGWCIVGLVREERRSCDSERCSVLC